MDAADTIRAYYDALRAGEPLAPFFAAERAGDPQAVKFGISERLVGVESIREGLRDQTERTVDWAVDSRALRVTERERHAWFADDVTMGWTDTERGIRYEFETRWSGTLERRETADTSPGTPESDWRFVGMHVSTAGEI
ncbi:nuclear transport factor 2 family protein [Halorientalis halophila]|uniref:nuclear transport factor 2 family protein n=1 Tax=Halorientalis halophila TaxID=3108499 RepID=UPI00300B711A